MNRKPNSAERVERTLIMARRTLTEPKAAFAGVIPDISFARFRASMATLNAERILSLPSCRWDFEAIVETRSRRKETVRHRGCEGEAEPNLGMSCNRICLVQTQPFEEEILKQMSSRMHLPIAQILRFATNTNAPCDSYLPHHGQTETDTKRTCRCSWVRQPRARSVLGTSLPTAQPEVYHRKSFPSRSLNSPLMSNAVVRCVGFFLCRASDRCCLNALRGREYWRGSTWTCWKNVCWPTQFRTWTIFAVSGA